jgi:hypothetical protein
MQSSNHWPHRQVAAWLVLLLAIPTTAASSAAAQQPGPVEYPKDPSAPQVERNNQTAGTAEDTSASDNTLPDNPAPVSSQTQDQTGTSQAGSSQQQNGGHKPVGTAAAPFERTMGVAASRPAGAAIAPAKQRRVRTILISVGVIVGTGIAVGSVAALSHGSPSHP